MLAACPILLGQTAVVQRTHVLRIFLGHEYVFVKYWLAVGAKAICFGKCGRSASAASRCCRRCRRRRRTSIATTTGANTHVTRAFAFEHFATVRIRTRAILERIVALFTVIGRGGRRRRVQLSNQVLN